MSKKLLILFTFIFILLMQSAYAEDVITADISCNGQIVTVNGTLPNTSEVQSVTIFVGSLDNILYINQKFTSDTGAFSFTFSMPDDLSPGVYDIAIGTNAGISTYYGQIYYNVVSNNFISADLDIDINFYVPTLTGTVSCTEGKTACLSIINITDNKTICNETLTSETGVFNISYTLPSLVSNKEYEITVSCYENDETISQISAVIDSSILAVDITGNIALAEDIEMDIHVQSSDISVINTSRLFNSSQSFSGTVPNLIPYASIKITANGYETVPVNADESWITHTVTTPPDEFKIITSASNITDFNNKTFTLKYNENQVEPVSFFGMQHEDIVGIGKVGNINIISHSSGKIVFSVEGITIPESKVWNGITNVFKFRFKPEYSGSTEIKIR